MTTLDAATRSRLDELRRTDSIGLYTSEESTEGTDPTGALRITLDPTARVSEVTVLHVETLRSQDGLRRAFDAAYAAALASRLPPRTTPDGPMPEVRSIQLTVRRPTLHQLRKMSRTGGASSFGGVAARAESMPGVSNNGCATYTLPTASAHGRFTVDPGWLSQATTTTLTTNLNQAIADAHEKRDRS